MTLKKEIETQVLPDMEARLNNKINAISKIIEKENAKNHRQQQISSNMSVASSNISSHHQTVKQKAINIILT